jgi:hypothetical protein
MEENNFWRDRFWMLSVVFACGLIFQQLIILKTQRRVECERYELYSDFAELAIFTGNQKLLDSIQSVRDELSRGRGPEEYVEYCRRY